MMAVEKRKFRWLAVGVVAMIGLAGAAWYFLQGGNERLPYINAAGVKKLKYFDHQIDLVQQQGSQRRTDLDYAVTLVEAMLNRAKVTADGRDFANAMAVIDSSESLIATRTRTEDGATAIPELFAARAKLLAAQHRFVEARAVAEKALRKYQNETGLMAIAGEAAVQAGDLNAGEIYLRKLVSDEPRVPNNFIGLAYWAEISGDLEQASELLKRAPEARFPKPLPRLRLAYVYSVQGDVQSKLGKLAVAKQYYNEAVNLEPTFAQARAGLSDIAQYEGRDQDAEDLLRALIETEWPNADYQVKLADLRERRGDVKEAKQLRRAAEKFYEWSYNTGFYGYVRPLAILKMAKGDFDAAAKYAAVDLEIRPNSESKAIYKNVYDAALAAGEPLGENALEKLKAGTTTSLNAGKPKP